ncbi:MAG: hypothetical protein CVU02_01025 [Bacteroidetes bacterium HGW-Bacteroidetes-19]|nr:MAG: hypothetical protein CVU04_04785 [Bacteroidetes bacterium HGW-Bacteroidetes-20]PKP28409.1 MAG: hypothetical protein CVU02_01025 [Bacteroidetes bacterium HGW-Bacteroidetes-19]
MMKTIIIILFIVFILLGSINIYLINTIRGILREFGEQDSDFIINFFSDLKLLKQINKQENGTFRTLILIANIVYSIDIIIPILFFLYAIFDPFF